MYTSYLRVYTGLCHGRQVDERNEVAHTTSTAHLQLPIQHACNQVTKDLSPLPLTDQTNFLSPSTSATANNGAMTKLLITNTYLPGTPYMHQCPYSVTGGHYCLQVDQTV